MLRKGMKELIDKNKTLDILTGLAEYFANTEECMYESLPSLKKGLQIAIETIKMMKPEDEKNFPKNPLWDAIPTGVDADGDIPHEENLQTVLYRRMNE